MRATKLILPIALCAAAALAACGDGGGTDPGRATTAAVAATPAAASATPAATSVYEDATETADAAPATTANPADLLPPPLDATAEDLTADYALTPWSNADMEATDMRFLPDGRALVITKGGWAGAGTGQVKLFDADGRFVRDVLDVPVCGDGERGLVGLEVDPDFARTQRIFLFYTRQMSDCFVTETPAPDGVEPRPVYDRVSSFVFQEDGIDPSSERVILDELPGHGPAHHGGGLAFMPDGTLLVATGEGSYARSRDLDFPKGKVLRVDVSGDVPEPAADNPYAGDATSSVRPYVYASGLRNPFRIGVDPRTGRVAAADVGTDVWEEVDLLKPGGDYGFPEIEGPGSEGGSLPPTVAYRHEGGCNSVIGTAWVPKRFVRGAEHSLVVFSDLGCPEVWALETGTKGPRLTRLADTLPKSLASIVTGPDGALYLVVIGPGAGPIYRLARKA